MAEPKKKIIIKKKTATVKGASKDAPKKAIQAVAKKTDPSSSQPTPPPEIISTQSEKNLGIEPNQTIIAEPQEADQKAHVSKESFKFYCIRCGQKLEAYYDWVDRSIQCPRCSSRIKIPGPPDA